MSTTQFLHEPAWRDVARARLLSGWDKEKIRAWFEALGTGAQLQEDTTFDLIVGTTFELATGDALDKWGELVDEQRLGLGDAEYRNFIRARMLVNRSLGTVDDLIEVLDVATSPNIGVFHLSNFPAGFYLVTKRLTFMGDEVLHRVGRLLEDARPGGRHMTLIESVTGGFGFSEDDDAEGFDVGPFSRLITPG